MRSDERHPLLRRALGAGVAVALLAVVSPAGAARDPLAEAEARITSTRRAANAAAAAYDAAQSHLYELESDIASTRAAVDDLRAETARLQDGAHRRALLAYKHQSQSIELDDFVGGNEVLAAKRRTELLARAGAQDDDAVRRLSAMTEDLHIREGELAAELQQQQELLEQLHAREVELQRALVAAQKAEQALRERLARERRQAEAEQRLRRARAGARAAPASTGRAGQIFGGGGSWVCPVQGGSSFSNSWGAARSGGRGHRGVDMMAGNGTPLVAVVGGSVSFNHDRLGGNAAYLAGNDGNTYYYAHLNGFVGGNRSVSAGELIGYVGSSGNAPSGAPHLHFEIRPGGGGAVNPYATVRAHC